jgi:hypothetical protein
VKQISVGIIRFLAPGVNHFHYQVVNNHRTYRIFPKSGEGAPGDFESTGQAPQPVLAIKQRDDVEQDHLQAETMGKSDRVW